jgi:hypothetical protein
VPTSTGPFNCTLRMALGQGRPCLVYLYDFAGTDPGEYTLPDRIDGLLYLVEMPEQPAESCLPASMFHGARFDVPLAMVLFSKSPDAPAGHDLAGIYASPAVAAHEAERDSASLRLFLVQHGLGDFANALEIRFQRVAFFVGGDAGHENMAALAWLAFHAGALSDEPSWYLAPGNLARYIRHAFFGREGRYARNTAWGLLVVGSPLLLLVLGCGLGPWAPLAVIAGTLAAGLWHGTRRPA